MKARRLMPSIDEMHADAWRLGGAKRAIRLFREMLRIYGFRVEREGGSYRYGDAVVLDDHWEIVPG